MPRRNVTTREEVLTAAAAVVVQYGVAGAHPARVAERCGVSVGTLYNHFAGKDELLVAVADRVEQGFVACMESAAPADQTLRPQLPGLAAGLLTVATQSPLVRILLELPDQPGGATIRQWIAARVRVAQRCGEVGAVEPDLVADLAYALVKAALPHASSAAAREQIQPLLAAGLSALLPAG